ncbi:MAG: FdhF/YdeP family oxidoreductase [Enhygromyxa sp.]
MRDRPDPPGDAPGPDEPGKPAQIGTRALASALPPLVTAPLSVERPPQASGGPAAALVGIDDTLRKPGLVRGLRLLRALNQERGFVCPGCAWPTPEHRARFELCESGVRAVADEADSRRAEARSFAAYTIPELARRSDHWLASQGRLTEPMIRRPQSNGYEPIGWDEAIALVGSALAALPDPGRAVFYSSARVANEPAFCQQLLARALGTNNLASSSQLCHEASRVALREVLGDPGACVSLADFDHAEAIFLFGCNPGSNHPRMLQALRAARLRGAKIVAFNPLREASLLRTRRPREWLGDGTATVDLLLPVHVAGDLAALVGLGKALLEAGAVDRQFIAEHTEGFEQLEAALARWSWAEVHERSGLDEASIRAAADIYARSKATIICWGVGLTQHREGVATVAQLLNLLLLRGNLGKPGAGPLALLGHSNTRGCWTMGLTPKLEPAARERLAAATGLQIPSEPGLGVVEAIEAMHQGEVDVLLCLGGNLLSAAPDTEQVAAALRRCKLTVHIATKLNRAHLITGETGLLLPCLGRSEVDRGRFVSFEDMCGTVRSSRGRVPPAGAALRSELEILTAIGAAAVPDALDWSALGRDYDRVRELIAAALPGCEGFATTLARDRSLVLREPIRVGRARLEIPPEPGPLRREGEFLLTTVRSHDQHNSTIYSHGDRERGISGYRRVVLMNLADIRELGIEPFDQVDLTCSFGERDRLARRWVAIPHHIPRGMLAAYWPEANALVPSGEVDPRSGTPAFKSVIVTVQASS